MRLSHLILLVRHSSSTLRRNLHICRSIEEMRLYRQDCDIPVHFVPTMGALHEGHLRLVDEAHSTPMTSSKPTIIASIFVNPTQFAQGEDLDKYPRTFDQDIALLTKRGVDCVFAPTANQMYPSNSSPIVHVETLPFLATREGQARPSFFRGVATVCTKLFNIVQPTRAYFGQKDAGQSVLLKGLVRDLNIPTTIQICETTREGDGLAKSSRNVYLTPIERDKAGIIYSALMAGVATYEETLSNDKDRRIASEVIIEQVRKVLHSEPLVQDIEYISVASPYNMQELDVIKREEGAVLSLACKVGNVRLIDNLLVGRARHILLQGE